MTPSNKLRLYVALYLRSDRVPPDNYDCAPLEARIMKIVKNTIQPWVLRNQNWKSPAQDFAFSLKFSLRKLQILSRLSVERAKGGFAILVAGILIRLKSPHGVYSTNGKTLGKNVTECGNRVAISC
ncbi:hypothetical protein I7I48_10863 [Histoplasma ohiense]|nr:hypothetical protein I7I48_10863 [Histoplasma ohiense (nom. inval.)]